MSPELQKQIILTARQLGLTPSEVVRQAVSFYMLSISKKKEAEEL